MTSERPDLLHPNELGLDGPDMVRLVEAAADAIAGSFPTLDELDAAVGDGDHGVNLQRAMEQARQDVRALPSPLPRQVLEVLERACRDRMAGAAGILFGAFFGAMADALADRTYIDATAVAAALNAGAQSVEHLGGARVGDKTMLDALVPAASAAQDAAVTGSTIAEALTRAAEAAGAGARKTRHLQARLGRARYVGSKSIGVADPGATSIATIFSAWARAATEGGFQHRPNRPRTSEARQLPREGGGR